MEEKKEKKRKNLRLVFNGLHLPLDPDHSSLNSSAVCFLLCRVQIAANIVLNGSKKKKNGSKKCSFIVGGSDTCSH
jgi:hypothetical protein